MLQVKINLTWFDSQFPLSSNPNYSESMNEETKEFNFDLNLILTCNIYEVQCFSNLGGGEFMARSVFGWLFCRNLNMGRIDNLTAFIL